jgi:hypothetical protein
MPVVFFYDQPGFLQQFEAVFMLNSVVFKCIPLIKTIPQLELLDGIISKTPLSEIAQADAFALISFPKILFIKILGIIENDKQTLTLILLLDLFRGLFFLLNLHPIFLPQIFQSIDVTQAIIFHNEIDRITLLPGAEIFKILVSGKYDERGGFLVGKGASGFVVLTGSL